MLWARISIRARCTTLCDKYCQWLAPDRWFSPHSPVSSTNKSGRHDITEILLKVAFSFQYLTLVSNESGLLMIFIVTFIRFSVTLWLPDLFGRKSWQIQCLFVCLMVFDATFNNISVISWRPDLLVEINLTHLIRALNIEN
jgi:hypothetical protein